MTLAGRTADEPRAPRRHDFPGRRWFMVALRTLHLMAVIALGAQLHGASLPPDWSSGRVGAAVLVTGLAMLVLDVLVQRQHLRTVAGLTALLKLVLVGILAADPEPFLFWALVILSGVVSHAPAGFRHAVVISFPETPRG